MRAMKRRWILLAIAGGVACFVLGIAASRWLSPTPAPSIPAHDGGAPQTAGVEPRIVIDPDSINLLPDASLRLELPSGFDAGLE